MRKNILFITLVLLTCANARAGDTDAHTAYAALSGLAGTWQREPVDDKSYTISIRPTAAGSALVETWNMSPTRESMTIYALDGERLLATHYCPQGNQPRLQYTGKDEHGRYQFRFLDGTNLQDPTASHEEWFWIDIQGPDRIVRGEYYVPNVAPDDTQTKPEPTPEHVVFTRISTP